MKNSHHPVYMLNLLISLRNNEIMCKF